jgi:hypothetical protein
MNINKCSKGKWIINTPLGSGKSRAIIQMAKEGKFETPHLIVVDTKEEVNRYRTELPGYKWYYQTEESLIKKKFKNALDALIEVKRASHDMYFDFVIECLESKLKKIDKKEMNSNQGLIITKAMFNEYLKYQYGDPLAQFKTITIDELSNLEILSSFPLKDEYTCFLSNEPNFHETILKSKLIEVICPVIENPKTFFENLVATNSKAFFKKIMYSKNIEIVMKNMKLFRLLNSDNLNIQILDATATFNSYFYNALKNYKRIDSQTRQYNNLMLNKVHLDTGYINKISKFRINIRDHKEEIKQKIEIINSLNIKEPLIFSNKDTVEALKKYMPYKTLDYIYSGNDIGTNKYRNHTDLCILYGQKINKEYVDILSYYFEKPAKDIQDNLIAARTIQLIGRTAIRNPGLSGVVNVSIINFPELEIDKVLSYYKGSTCYQTTYSVDIEEKTDIGRIMKHIKINNLKLEGLENDVLRKQIKEFLPLLRIDPKDSKSMSNLLTRATTKIKEFQEL